MNERRVPQPLTPQPFRSISRFSVSVAWSAHFYTALGTVAAFLGTLAVIDGRYRAAFGWMIVATLIDATDGVFARMARVKELVPGFDGALLDDIVDYLTFVFLPVLLLHHAGNLPEGWGILVASAVLLSSGYGFASTDAKTDDHFFTGFPSYWNIVALYLHSAALPPVVNAAILLFLVLMVFVRIGYVYPSRTPILQGLTLVLGLVWGVMLLEIVRAIPNVPRPLLIASLFFPVYYTVLSWFLHARRQRARS